MKLKGKFLGLGVAALTTGLLASCSNELNGPMQNPQLAGTLKLVKDPDFVAYSGEQLLGNSFGTRTVDLPAMYGTRASEANWQQYKKVQDYDNKTSWSDWDIAYDPYYPYKDNAPSKSADRGENVSQAEYDYVMEYIRTHEGGVKCNLNTYFIQNVGSSYDHYKYDYYDSQNDVDRSVEFTGGNQMDYLVIGDYHIGDYNASGGPRALCINMPINAPEISPTYHDSWGTENQTKENAYRFYIITLPNDPIYGENAGKTAYYLGFDYKTQKWDNGDINYEGDCIYNDWVVKIMPADGSTITPENPNPDPEVPEIDIPEDLDPGFGITPETPTTHEGTVIPKNHVEVNLSIDKKAAEDWLATHLSIHVRAATDVEIFIPLPAKYYCDADDMAIVQQHLENFMVHGGPRQIAYEIDGNEVTLTVSFEEEGIRVTTDGINEDVISYLNEKYGDGITFEIWNYINIKPEDWNYDDPEYSGIVEEIKEYLDQSTIKFLDDFPDLYVNAFNDTESGAKFEDDCTVDIVDLQKSEYNTPEEGYHYNGSQYNQLYYNKDYSPEEVE